MDHRGNDSANVCARERECASVREREGEGGRKASFLRMSGLGSFYNKAIFFCICTFKMNLDVLSYLLIFSSNFFVSIFCDYKNLKKAIRTDRTNNIIDQKGY